MDLNLTTTDHTQNKITVTTQTSPILLGTGCLLVSVPLIALIVWAAFTDAGLWFLLIGYPFIRLLKLINPKITIHLDKYNGKLTVRKMWVFGIHVNKTISIDQAKQVTFAKRSNWQYPIPYYYLEIKRQDAPNIPIRTTPLPEAQAQEAADQLNATLGLQPFIK